MDINKLIILYIFEQLEVPMQEGIVTSMVVDNNWMTFMECKSTISELLSNDLITNMTPNTSEPRYGITMSGREGLSYFYTAIPISIRESIANNIKQNGLNYRKKQEYISDYYKNKDGTYTVALKIESAACTLMDLKIVVQTRNNAKRIYKNWPDKASIIYEHIYENLIE